MEYKKHRVDIFLTEEEERFIKNLAKEDEIKFQEECRWIFETELRQLMELRNQ